jgi:WD40 repeat protein
MYKFKAFISYSRAADGKLAPALKLALQDFAKPWYQFRAISVFCDQTNLTANPNLWNSIEKELDNAEYFIYLASPQAAQSKWVRKELQYFIEKRGVQNVIIVLTDGTIQWDEATQNFSWDNTTTIPRFEEPLFGQEPVWADLSWIRKEQLSVHDARFLDVVANLSAALRGIDKDTLIGQNVEEHRKATRFRRFSITGLVLLALFLFGAAFVAFRSEQQSQQRLVRTFVGNGNALLENGDYLSALPWYVEALTSERDEQRKGAQRAGIDNLINQAPALAQVWQATAPVLATQFLDENRVLVLCGNRAKWMTSDFPCFTGEESEDDTIPHSACHATIQVLDMHTGKAAFPALAVPDGIKDYALATATPLLATLSVTNVLSLWDLRNGKLRWQTVCDSVDYDIINLSMDIDSRGERILVTKNFLMQVFDASQGKKIASYDSGPMATPRFIHSDTILFVSEGSLQIWGDIRHKKPVAVKLPVNGENFEISPNRKYLAVSGRADEEQAVLACVELRHPEDPLFVRKTENLANKLAFNAASSAIAANSSTTNEGDSMDDGTKVWSITGEALTDLIKLDREVSIGFDEAGRKLVITSADGTVQLWRLAESGGRSLASREILLHDGGNEPNALVNADDLRAKLNAQGYLLTVTNQLIKLWKLPNAELLRPDVADKHAEEEPVPNPGQAWEVAIKNSEESTVADSSIALMIDRKTKKVIGKPLQQHDEVLYTEVSPDGRLIVIFSANRTSVWRSANQEQLYTFPPGSPIRSMRFSKDSKKLILTYPDYSFCVWNSQTFFLTPTFRHSRTKPWDTTIDAFFSKDGDRVITYERPFYRIWDAATGDPLSAPIELETDEDADVRNARLGKKSPLTPFRSSNYTQEQLKDYVELLSNQRLDPSGSLLNLTTSEYLERWRKWKQKK